MKLIYKNILLVLGMIFIFFVSATISYRLSVLNGEKSLNSSKTASVQKVMASAFLPEHIDFQPTSLVGSTNGLQDIDLQSSEDIRNRNEHKQKKKQKKKKLTKVEKYKKQISNIGLTDLTQSDDDALEIHKKANKKSKVEGYLADGSIMTVVNKKGNWYQIKSGDIDGYVSAKYVVRNKKVESSMMENRNVSAIITKGTVPVLSETQKNSSVVGMGYKDGEYPILELSANEQYALIERTESISGWVPVSDINIKITAPTAMTKDEFDDYQNELALEEQQALNSYLSLKINSTGNKLQDSIIKLIAHNESGNYKAARNPKTSGEKSITVGAWQWYGENAHNILRLICAANTDKAKSIIEGSFKGNKGKANATQLYKDIMGYDNWESSKRIFSNPELIAIKELLGSSQGLQVQNSKIQIDIQAKIRVAISTYKLTNDGLTAYFCDLFWQNPQNARQIVNECIAHYGSAKKFCDADDGLKYLHKTAMKNGVMGKYSQRRNYTYMYCKNL